MSADAQQQLCAAYSQMGGKSLAQSRKLSVEAPHRRNEPLGMLCKSLSLPVLRRRLSAEKEVTNEVEQREQQSSM